VHEVSGPDAVYDGHAVATGPRLDAITHNISRDPRPDAAADGHAVTNEPRLDAITHSIIRGPSFDVNTNCGARGDTFAYKRSTSM
jgi:hypothetical protein